MVKVPLKSVLRNFLNHFETLESRHKLCHSSDDSIDLYIREFQALKELTESLKSDPNCGSNEGENEVNKRKNRYKDILPYDHSRVILSEYPGVPGSDYMNANYVRGSSGCSRAYIASQGPLPNTVVDFWRMIWESDVTVIVMACNEREAGKYKCESYWPQDNDERQQYGNITVELVKWRQVCPDFLVRTLKVTADATERTVCQFHYQTWPDHGVPQKITPILELVRLMRDVQASEARPILIHCSAGCGRTGTICCIDYVWALLRTGKLKQDFSLFTIIKEMRKQRIAMVQTVEQYMLCYKAVATLFEQQLKMIDAHTYENIDGDGEPIMRRELLDDGLQHNGSSNGHNSDDSIDPIDAKDRNDVLLCSAHNSQQNSVKLNTESIPTSNTSPSKHNEEVRHERLVGKATVIRRPSIAKLKAIFENQSAIPSEPPLVRSRSTSSSLQRSHSIKENMRYSRSLIEANLQDLGSNDSKSQEVLANSEQIISNNYYEQPFKQRFNNQMHTHSDQNTDQQPIYAEYNQMVQKLDESAIDNSQTFQSNQRSIIQTPHFNLHMCQSSQLPEQKIYNHNHQQLQQQIRQHLQQQQQQQQQQQHLNQSQQMHLQSHSHQIHVQSGAPLPLQSQLNAQMTAPIAQLPPLPPLQAPPKPPRTYQHIVDEAFNPLPQNSVPNSSEGRIIVSVALPRRQTSEVNPSIHNNHYEPLGQRRCNISSPNLVSDTVLVNGNNVDNFNNNYINSNNSSKMINMSNANIYESVLPKYKTQALEPNGVAVQSTHNSNNFTQSYFDVMKIRNNGLNSTLPFYDSIYGRRGFMTIPNVRHIQVPNVTQVQCSYPQFKHSYENIYSTNNLNPNNNNVIKTEKPNTERIASNFVRNVDKSNDNKIVEQSQKLQNKVKPVKKENNLTNHSSNSKTSLQKNELTKNVSTSSASNSQTIQSQDNNSGTFSKFTNAFKGFRNKSTKSKNKTSANTNNSSPNNVNGPTTISRPPHSHRFSPPTQWTQV